MSRRSVSQGLQKYQLSRYFKATESPKAEALNAVCVKCKALNNFAQCEKNSNSHEKYEAQWPSFFLSNVSKSPDDKSSKLGSKETKY